MQGCLRRGYLVAVFSYLAMIVAIFVRPECGLAGSARCEPDLTRRLFVATPLVTALGIDSIFTHIMLAGVFQIIVSFGIGLSIGLLLRVVRQVV